MSNAWLTYWLRLTKPTYNGAGSAAHCSITRLQGGRNGNEEVALRELSRVTDCGAFYDNHYYYEGTMTAILDNQTQVEVVT